jgi:dsRNA-specific ribonuclease
MFWNYDTVKHIVSQPSSLREFQKAFTSSTIDPKFNYEVYEQLGDLSANKIVVQTMYERFPQLRNPEGVKVVARLRIKYVSKKQFSDFAFKLGFWDYVIATQDEKDRNRKSLLEDTFEAFIGCLETVIDQYYGIGAGFSVVYSFLNPIIIKLPMSLDRDQLFDAKTRLKEIFDKRRDLGRCIYETVRGEDKKFTTKVFVEKDGKRTLIGKGVAFLKLDAEQHGAQKALNQFKDI